MQFKSNIGYKKIGAFNANSIDKSLLSIFIVAMLAMTYQFLPKTANAGLFSFNDKASAKSIETNDGLNSQNMILLEAAVNSDPNPHKSTDQVILAYGNALSAEIGPQGTAMEVENKVSHQISLYTVRKGDTISKVAQMFDVSINTIVWANELGKNITLKEGQMLVILPISGIRYTVKKGDTIKGIVLRHKANLDEVLQYNDLTISTTLKPGDTIVIPDAEPTYTDVSKISQSRKGTSNKNAFGTNGVLYPGYYNRPVDGAYKSQGIHGYNAVDYAAPVGAIIRASAAGKVISSISNGGWNGGYGNYVIISHDNGTQTLYAHTQKNFVSVGDIVEQGEMIAKVGMTGKTTGPHVHFEIRGAKNPF